MNRTAASILLLLGTALTGCHLPGKPLPGSTPQRPDQITNFETLYSSNCAACHGANGHGGAAVALASPAYLAYAGLGPLQTITANGIPGSLMPAFSKSNGGLLTDEQVSVLAHGILAWATPQQLAGLRPPIYQSQAVGDLTRGEALYRTDCLHCHAPGRGSILDPVYLSLVTDGGLRTLLVTGKPQSGMPDWRGYPAGPLTDQQLADLVTFLVSHRNPAAQPLASNTIPSSTEARKAARP